MPDVMWGYNTLAFIIILYSFVMIIGLYKKFEWARISAIYFNLIIIFFFGILKFIPIVMKIDFFSIYTVSEVLLNLLIILCACYLIIFYCMKQTKNLFIKKVKGELNRD